MKHVQQAVEIAQKKLSSTHPDLVKYRQKSEKIRDNSSALVLAQGTDWNQIKNPT